MRKVETAKRFVREASLPLLSLSLLLSPTAPAESSEDETDAAIAVDNLALALNSPDLLTNVDGLVGNLAQQQGFNFGPQADPARVDTGMLAEPNKDPATLKLPPTPSELPSQEEEPTTADDYHNRGLEYYNQGEYQLALEDFNRVVELDPREAYSYHSRGLAYQALNMHEPALADYNRALQLYEVYAQEDQEYYTSNTSIVYYNRGVVYHDLGEYQQALANYDQAIDLNPEYAPAYNNRGVVYYDLGEYQLALAD